MSASPPSPAEQKRGLIIIIILSILATVGMFCLILGLVVCKNKRDKKKRAATLAAAPAGVGVSKETGGYLGLRGGAGVLSGGGNGGKGRYERLGDEEEGVWSLEMGGRRGNGYEDGGSGERVDGLGYERAAR